ncbi:MAG TPA: SDR family oxidoreductase [Dehalococcoidia bacterium]|nr:SDR family oxidoreductase [Dehalococcoidia bacterium]
MAELTGQVAIVTGGGRGIGRAIALALAAAGAAVTVTARSADQLGETAAAITAAGGRALVLPADVTDRQAVEGVVSETEQQLGPVTLLVNNAGIITPFGPVWEVDPEAWRRCMDTNVYGTFLCSRAVLPGMIARREGRIVNLAGSDPAQKAVPMATCYDGSKAVILRLSEGLAAETREYGVSVFSLMPGGVHTAMVDELVRSPWMLKLNPAVGDFDRYWRTPPERAAALCVLIASGRADALSGRFLSVHDDLEELVRNSEEICKEDRYVLRLKT